MALSSVTLPNGTQWKFAYNQYGDLQTLTYPTGATVTYTWGNNGGTTRAIQSRVVNTGQRSDTWKYSYSANDTSSTMTETDPLGDTISHTSSGGAETSTIYTDVKTGWASSTNYVYTHLVANANGQYPTMQSSVHFPAFFNQVRRKAITTLPNGLTKQTCWIYDNDTDTACTGNQEQPSSSGFVFYDDAGHQANSSTPTVPYPLVLGKVLYQYESDWGQGNPGPWLRTTLIHYKWQDSAAYLNANLLNVPTSVCVPLPGKTACTPSTADTASYTSYGYDENNGSPQGAFGNQTSSTAWAGSGPSVTTSTVFNGKGMPQTTLDAAKNATAYSYDASGLYPNKITSPATPNAAHITQPAYDIPSGVLVSTTDENGQRTGYSYDAMRRVLSITHPVGYESYSYNDAAPSPSISFSKQLNSSQNYQTLTILDGLGRTIHTVLTDPQGNDTVDTAYDALGRVASVSNPYRSTSDQSYGLTSYTYDVLGRTVSTTHPDSSQSTWKYTGKQTLLTDEGNMQRQQTTDGLGRLIQVLEPDPSSGKLTLETDYVYDLLNNLTGVAQWGGPAGSAGKRGRVFTYDGLSRLIMSSPAEARSTTYAYATPSGAPCSGDPASPCTRTDGRGVITTYTYDAESRLIQKSYSDGTSSANYEYDQPGEWGVSCVAATGTALVSCYNSGRLTHVFTGDFKTGTALGYDAMGRLNVKATCVDAQCGSTRMDRHFLYDLAGNPQSSEFGFDVNRGLAYGGVAYSYDAAGRLAGASSILDTKYTFQAASAATTLYSVTGFSAVGIKNATVYNGGAAYAESRNYDSRARYWNYSVGSSSTPTLYSWSVYYPPNNNPSASQDTVNGNWNYGYDFLNRLKSASSPGWGAAWNYDNFGNLQSQTMTAGSGVQGTPRTFNQSNNQPDNTCFDGAGNQLDGGPCKATHDFSYDGENRMVSSNGGTVGYRYGADGQRAAKYVNGALASVYLYDEQGRVVTELDGSYNPRRREAYLADGRHLGTWSGGQPLYTAPGATAAPTAPYLLAFADWLGTERARAGSTGALCQTTASLPYGDSAVTSGSCAPMGSYPTFYTGKERDQESGLDDFGARYYGAGVGRFLTPDWSAAPDPLPYGDPTNPQSLNLYAYVGNNPVALIDVDGHQVKNLGGGCWQSTSTATVSSGQQYFGPAGSASQSASDAHTETTTQVFCTGSRGNNRQVQAHAQSGGPKTCATIASNIATTKSDINNQGRTQALINFASRSWPSGSYNPFAAFSTIGLNDQSSWDYKAGPKDNTGAAFGNVNYGANCAQFGLGKYGCGSFAGDATTINSAHHRPQGPGVPFVIYPYGKQADSANMPSVMGGVDLGKGGACTGW